jgi:hypothetical protein
MYRILGNSSERIQIRDLNDVIYYRQIKEYTDQEFESSKDLNKEKEKGNITILDHYTSAKSALDGSALHSGSGISISDIKLALKEMMPGQNISTGDIRDAMREVAPLIVDMVRQEVSARLSSVSFGGTPKEQRPEFLSPEYIPNISTEGMVSHIEAETKEISGSTVNDTLAALRKLKGG